MNKNNPYFKYESHDSHFIGSSLSLCSIIVSFEVLTDCYFNIYNVTEENKFR